MLGSVENLERMSRVHVWVLGDLMLDEYVEGDVERISPEAPVPVVRMRNEFRRLGGSGNAALACAALGATVSLCGVIGDDDAGRSLLTACRAAGLDVESVARLQGRPTTRKLRVLSRGQQMLRLEHETEQPIARDVWQPLWRRLAGGKSADVILLSDYAKGALPAELMRTAIDWARVRGVPVVVDPKGRDYACYRGATVLTPNMGELALATGESKLRSQDHIERAARKLMSEVDVDAVVVTLGADGVTVVKREVLAVHLPARAKEVFDPTGAGDVVAAIIALGCGSGMSLVSAAEIANAAAGVSVARVGAGGVTPAEIAKQLEPSRSSAVMSAAELRELRRCWHLQGKTVVFTNGCFDVVHAGHLALLRHAAALGDVLVVAVNADASVSRLKGPGRPLTTETERAELLAALDCVDAVVVFEQDTPYELIEALRPDVLVKGGDYTRDRVVGADLVESWGGRVSLVPLVEARSTSSLVARVLEGAEGAAGNGRTQLS